MKVMLIFLCEPNSAGLASQEMTSYICETWAGNAIGVISWKMPMMLNLPSLETFA